MKQETIRKKSIRTPMFEDEILEAKKKARAKGLSVASYIRFLIKKDK